MSGRAPESLRRRAGAARLLVLALTFTVLAAAGCAARPPTGWQQGGTRLVVPRARWILGDIAVELDHAGRVAVNGKHVLTIDSAGRVVDPYNAPVALLGEDGLLVGTDDEQLGWVGAGEAMLPGERMRWLALMPSGELVRFDDEGLARPFGVWMGCNLVPHTLQACTLVSHIVGIVIEAERRSQGDPGLSVGFGLGVGVGVP